VQRFRLLGHFLFDQEQMHRPIATLSPGERSRLLIAMLVSSGAELLLLDEPTNHLDFYSITFTPQRLATTILRLETDQNYTENATFHDTHPNARRRDSPDGRSSLTIRYDAAGEPVAGDWHGPPTR
jgi:ABC-type lipoprotein export system ATPase subunit